MVFFKNIKRVSHFNEKRIITKIGVHNIYIIEMCYLILCIQMVVSFSNDYDGLMHDFSRMFLNCFALVEVEALALHEVKWILQLQLSNVTLDMDCKSVVWMIFII